MCLQKQLTDAQLHCFWHLSLPISLVWLWTMTTLNNRENLPLRVVVHGGGGTGKAKVVKFVMSLFGSRAASRSVVMLAYTGIVTLLIDGKTAHCYNGNNLS